MSGVRRLIYMDEVYWQALRAMARDKGYGSRNDLVVTILKGVVDREPAYLEWGMQTVEVKDMVKQMEAPWEPELRELGEEEMKAIFGEDITPSAEGVSRGTE